MSACFPAQHEKAHITKDHICQRFGAEGKGEALYCISKVQAQSWKLQLQSRRVLTAFHRRPLFRSACGYHIRQERRWKEIWAIKGSTKHGCDDWASWLVCTRSNNPFFSHYLGLIYVAWMLMFLKLSAPLCWNLHVLERAWFSLDWDASYFILKYWTPLCHPSSGTLWRKNVCEEVSKRELRSPR